MSPANTGRSTTPCPSESLEPTPGCRDCPPARHDLHSPMPPRTAPPHTHTGNTRAGNASCPRPTCNTSCPQYTGPACLQHCALPVLLSLPTCHAVPSQGAQSSPTCNPAPGTDRSLHKHVRPLPLRLPDTASPHLPLEPGEAKRMVRGSDVLFKRKKKKKKKWGHWGLCPQLAVWRQSPHG